MKKKQLLAGVLSVALTASLITAPAAAASPFKDLDGHWAQKDVEYLAAKGLASGYSDGTFKPDAAMSTLEALLFCARVTSVDVNTKTRIKEDRYDDLKAIIPPDMLSWAAPDLAVCLETGIITEDELKAICDRKGLLKAIEREDVMLYLARAMQLDEVTESLSAYPLSYGDEASISKEMRPYVYILSTYGVIKGDQVNNFNPKTNLNRASMTSVLRRALDFMKARGIVVELPAYTSYSWMGGVIRSTTVGEKGTVELKLESPLGGTQTIVLPEGVRVYENNMLTTGSALRLGKYARVNLDEKGTPTAVRVSGALEMLQGDVKSLKDGILTVETPKGTVSFQPDRFVQVRTGKNTVGGLGLLDEKANYSYAICYVDELDHLAAVELTGGTHEEGGLLAGVKSDGMGGLVLTVADMSGVKTRYTLPEGAAVTVNGIAKPLADEHLGDYVTLRVSNEDAGSVVSLNVDTNTQYIQGSVKGLSYGDKEPTKLTIGEFTSGKTLTYVLPGTVKISYDGKPSELSKVAQGWYVTLKLTGTEVTELMGYPGSVTEKGKITSISYGTPMTLEVTRENGTVLSYNLDMQNPPEIYRDGVRTTLDRIQTGDAVVVTVRYNEVGILDCTSQSASVSGTIRRITMDEKGTTLDVELTTGETKSYLVGTGVHITQKDKDVSVDALKPGFRVSMVLDGTRVLSIKVEEHEVVTTQMTGSVLYVNTATNEILIQQTDSAGVTTVITVKTTGTEMRDDNGQTIRLKDLKTGDTLVLFGIHDGLIFRANLLVRT